MKIRYITFALLFAGLAGCSRNKKQIAGKDFIDSLITHYQEPAFSMANDSALIFWKNKINPHLPGILSEMKYAAALSLRFHLYGDLRDIETADSLLCKLDTFFRHHESAAQLCLMRNAIIRHRFKEAGEWFIRAKNNGLKKYDLLTASFDVDFELGRIFNAAAALKELKTDDYGYYFRRSKMDHLKGNLDSAIHAMERAAQLEKNSSWLEQIALSNAADLLIHEGDLEKAAALYTQCLRLNGADFHSLSGLGWIALAEDHNDSLAERIFSFVLGKNKLPDALYKLAITAEFRGDSFMERKYAQAFAQQASSGIYGNMYNKYLIELYTGILKDPAHAEYLAKGELENRATPQTYAWYAWALFSNNKKETAMELYKKNISGMPLEGLELYWMGKLMQGMNKEYNAKAFFEAAYTNKYDLTPGIRKDLEIRLQE